MITIQIAHINITINFKFEDQFYNIQSYQVEDRGEYWIESHFDDFDMNNQKPTQCTEFYDLYEIEGQTIQHQKMNGNTIGFIVYQDKRIDLYLKQKNFVTEYLLSQYALLYILNQAQNAIFIHGSSIVYHSKGILFCAKSGTGKSTQARLWRTYTDAVPLNDDKNIIVLEKEQLMLYSNPWSGKHQIHQNIVAPIACIVFLRQEKENQVKKLSSEEAMRFLLGQIDPPKKKSIEIWNKMVDHILELPIYSYGCNMEESAVTTLKNRLEMDLCL